MAGGSGIGLLESALEKHRELEQKLHDPNYWKTSDMEVKE